MSGPLTVAVRQRREWGNPWRRAGECTEAPAVGMLAGIVLAGCATVQPAMEWGPRYATPGVALTLREVSRATVGKNEVHYQLRASGFPKGKTFMLWHRWIDGETEPSPQRWHVDDSGQLVSEKFPPLESTLFVVDKYAKGEPFELALISTDQTVKAFAKAIPFPVEGKQGRCHLWMELLSPTGANFVIQGEGFEPDEEVATEWRSNGGVREDKQTISPDGRLPVILLTHPGSGLQSGLASYTVTGKSCKLEIQYEWGPQALKKQ